MQKQKVVMIFFALLSSVVCLLICIIWFADKSFAAGYRGTRAGNIQTSSHYFSTAIALNPFEPLYHDEYASLLATRTLAALENRDATIAGILASESLSQNELAIRQSPNNINYWKTRTKILFSFATFDDSFLPLSITALNKAASLAPYDPKIVYNLAILWGKSGDMEKAIEYGKKAITLKQNYRDAYYALWVFYKEMDRMSDARAILQTYLDEINPVDAEFQKLLNQ